MRRRLGINITSDLYLETCCFLNREIDAGQYAGFEGPIHGINGILENLTPDLKAHLSWIRSEDHTSHMAEFHIHSGVKDMGGIIEYMRTLRMEQFYYLYYNESLSLAQIEALPKVTLASLQKNTLGLLDAVRERMESLYAEMVSSGIYDESIDDTFQALKMQGPLEFAQKKMDKTFKRVSDYDQYHFVPSVWMADTPHRFFNEDSMLLMWGMTYKPVPLTTQELAEILRTIGDQTRLSILKMIRTKPMYGKEIADELGIKAATVTHHIEQMKRHHLIHVEQHGQIKYYSVNFRTLRYLVDELQGAFK